MNDPTRDDPSRPPDPLPPAGRKTDGTDLPAASLAKTPADPVPPETADEVERRRQKEREAELRAYARLLDSAVRLPGGFRIGLDGIVGLVPVVGDLAGLGLSSYLVFAAARLGVRRSVLARMAANVALESAIGVVPIVGDAFDFVFKANERNVRLLERELARRDADTADAPER